MRLRAVTAALLLLLYGGSRAEPVKVYAAGSLSGVLPKLIAASGLPDGSVAPPTFGPAGALGQRLRGGETADLFASADLAQPDAVAAAKGGAVLVVPFARNRMCVLASAGLGLSAETLLDRLLAPGLRLAASTPGVDPGGDYARAVFARAEALRPGAEATLSGKALLLLGGPGSMAPRPGMSPIATIFAANAADALLYYCSGTVAAAREVPGLVSIPVPEVLEVGPVYGLAVLSGDAAAARLALFMLSRPGQAIIAGGGLLPLLPMLLGATVGSGVDGGSRARPAFITLGFVLAFSAVALLFGAFAESLETPAAVLRDVAIVMLVVFGLLMIVPHPLRWLAARMHRVVNAADAAGQRAGPGNWGGFVLGVTLGVVWTPCAGPVLGSILTVVATAHDLAWSGVLLLAYAVGAGIPMLLIGYGGQYVARHVRGLSRHAHRIQQVFGAAVILVAVGLYYQYDTVVTVWLSQFYPTGSLGL